MTVVTDTMSDDAHVSNVSDAVTRPPLKSILKKPSSASTANTPGEVRLPPKVRRTSFRLTHPRKDLGSPVRVSLPKHGITDGAAKGSPVGRIESGRCSFQLGADADSDDISSSEDLSNLQRYRGRNAAPLPEQIVRLGRDHRDVSTSSDDNAELFSGQTKPAINEVHPRKLSAQVNIPLANLCQPEENSSPCDSPNVNAEKLLSSVASNAAEESEDDDVMPDEENDLNFKRYIRGYRPPRQSISAAKKVTFTVDTPGNVQSEWRPGMVRSISEIAEGASMEAGHHEEEPRDKQPEVPNKGRGRRISNEHLSEKDIMLAAQYIKDAMETRTTFFRPDKESLQLYQWFNMRVFVVVLYICVIGDLALVLFEKPAVRLLEVPYWAPMIAESIFLLYFLGRLLHNFSFDRRPSFCRDYKNMFLVLGISLTVLDMCIYIGMMQLAPPVVANYAIRWSRPLRPIFLVAFPSGERLRLAFINVAKSLPEILAVLVLLVFSIAIFALIWFQLLKDKGLVYSNGAPYFTNYFDSFWDLYVLVTTANNPDVMLPAYDYHSAFAVLWFFYVCVNLYIFMNIALAVVYNGYKTRLKLNVKASVLERRRILEKTFGLLKVRHGDTYAVRSDRWHRVMAKVDKRFSSTKIDLMLYVLDDNGNGAIERKEFLMLSELISFDFAEVLEKQSWLETHCKSYDSPASVLIRKVIAHRYFEYVIDSLIVINAGCITGNIQFVEYIFLPLFTVEILLRIYALSPRRYFVPFGGNLLDFSLIFTPCVIFFIPSTVIPHETKKSVMEFLLVLRILRVVRSAHAVEQFHVILSTITKIAPFIITYGAVVFTFFYSYAILGMEIFRGRIQFHGYQNLTDAELYCGNPKLNGSEFWIKKYCSCNFNDFFHAMVVLFTMLVVNQWHEITNGFVLVTTKAARIYFILFHMSCVIILLNIFSALIIEAFFIVYQVQRSDLESYLQKKIRMLGLASGDVADYEDNQSEDMFLSDELMSMTGWLPARRKSVCDSLPNDLMLIQRRLKRNSRVSNVKFKIQDKSNMRVDTLLQRLFAGELDMRSDDDEGSGSDDSHWATLDGLMDTYSDIAHYTTNQ